MKFVKFHIIENIHPTDRIIFIRYSNLIKHKNSIKYTIKHSKKGNRKYGKDRRKF